MENNKTDFMYDLQSYLQGVASDIAALQTVRAVCEKQFSMHWNSLLSEYVLYLEFPLTAVERGILQDIKRYDWLCFTDLQYARACELITPDEFETINKAMDALQIRIEQEAGRI